MNTTKPIAGFFFALALAACAGNAWAQSDQDHRAHHPDEAQTQTNPTATPGMPMRQGGAMNGMRGQAMPGGGQDGMPGMMGGNMQPMMMRMMQVMRDRMANEEMGGPMGMMHFDHIEGRIAFLRAELGITEAQQAQWDAFADALRAQASTMRTMRERMMQGGMQETWPDLLSREEQMLAARVDALKAIEGPARALYAALAPEQQKKANELLAHPIGGM
ncbi:MAG: Spy/CpxP family protein refolding chaperone [Rhodopila sp.]|nr:Spy/CpxP family protein refolding chaperone [Rhodopila sp.]